MVQIRSFRAVRPKKDLAHRVAALPYDVYSVEEARKEIEREEYSFLKVDVPLATLPKGFAGKTAEVYLRAKEKMDNMLKEGIFRKDEKDNLYLYELTMKGRRQVGLVCCVSIDEYKNNTIKKHEKTREEKEEDRVRHVDALDANTGPIFLTYKDKEEISRVIKKRQSGKPEVSFVSPDGVEHRVWIIDDEKAIKTLTQEFKQVPNLYIADGHHRSASAVRVGEMRRKENPDYTGDEEFNSFLAILFPQSQVKVYDYNRVVKDLNGKSLDQVLKEIEENFMIELATQSPYAPKEKGEFGMFLGKEWYRLRVRQGKYKEDPINSLDVSILQNLLLDPILGIKDPRRDRRIDFIGGIRGLQEIERRVQEDMEIGFSLYPTSIEELINVADVDGIMPPKSTWFEPKPRSGLFIHDLK